MKKSVALVIALMLCLSLFTACGSETPADTATAPEKTTAEATEPAAELVEPEVDNAAEQTLRVGVEAEFTSLSPLIGGQVGYGTAICQSVYETLFTCYTAGEINPCLAKDYEWVDDNTLVLHLNEGVKFHNGNDFTASDVLFSLRLYGENPQYANRLQWIDFDAATADDDYTVTLKTTGYSATLVGNLTSELMLIMDEQWYNELDGNIDQQANGTGPYKLKAWNMGRDVVVEKNHDYWGGEPGGPAEVDVVFFNDPTTAVLEYEAGTLDVVYVQNAIDVETLVNGGMKDTQCIKVPMHTISGLAMSSAVGTEFLDGTLREAICLAIPVEEMINGITNGVYVPQDSMVPSSDPTKIEVGYYEVDTERAKELVEKWKQDNGKTECVLEMVNVSGTLQDKIAEAIQAYLAEVGITMNITTGQPQDIIPRFIAGEVNFTINQSGGGVDPADVFTSMERGGNAAAEIPNDEILDLLDEAKVTHDWNERVALYEQAQRLCHDTYSFLPLFESYTYYAVRDGISFEFGTGHYIDVTSVKMS